MARKPAGKKSPAKKSPRDIEKAYPTAQFVAKLRRLADALEEGKSFTIRVAGETLRIPADATFNIEHEREGATQELEFQLKWPASSPRSRK